MEVIRDPIFQRYIPFSVTSQGAMLALQGLWIGPWLRDVGGLTRAETASSLLIMALALASTLALFLSKPQTWGGSINSKREKQKSKNNQWQC